MVQVKWKSVTHGHTLHTLILQGDFQNTKTASVLPVICCSNSIPSMERLRTPPAANIRLCCKSWNSPDRLAMGLGVMSPDGTIHSTNTNSSEANKLESQKGIMPPDHQMCMNPMRIL